MTLSMRTSSRYDAADWGGGLHRDCVGFARRGRGAVVERARPTDPSVSASPPVVPVGWLDRWREATSGLLRLKTTHPMFDAVIDEVDGRRIRIGDHWLTDFASCNYLGFDLETRIVEGVAAYLRAW